MDGSDLGLGDLSFNKRMEGEEKGEKHFKAGVPVKICDRL